MAIFAGINPNEGVKVKRLPEARENLTVWSAITWKRCKIRLLGSRIWAFDWYQNRWPSMTLNGVMAIILHYFAEFGSFRV